MPSLSDLARLTAALPETVEGQRYGHRAWSVNGKVFVWERPFSKADIKRFGADPVPTGDILGISMADLSEKQAVLAAGTPGIFTIEHFNNYPALLIQLDAISQQALREALVDAWLTCAPPTLAQAYLRD